MRALAMMLGLIAALSTHGAPAHARPDHPRIEIVGGEQAGRHEFPWVVRLSSGCAGTLIGRRHVLTAAHCIRRTGTNRSIMVTAGSADLYSWEARKIPGVKITR